MTEKPPCKRRTVFIQPAFQGRFIAWMLAMIVVFGVCSAAILYFLLASDLENETRAAHLRIIDTWQKLGLSIILANAMSAIFIGISVTVVVLYISHKIAGPMYRLQILFKEVGRGNLDISVRLRDKDQLQELANSFDEMLADLRQRRNRQDAALQEAQGIVDQLKQMTGDSHPSRQLLADLERRLKGLFGN